MHAQLARQLRQMAETGVISPGVRLPSERSLAAALNVSRNTVTKAFDELRGEGLFSSHHGDGTYVTGGRRRPAPSPGVDRLGSFLSEGGRNPLSRIDLRSAALPGLQMTADEINVLDGSRMRALVASHGYLPSGLPELREAIAAYYCGLGLETAPEHILVTSGAQQALRLVASLYVEPGVTVAVEEPTFRGAIQSLKTLGARLAGIPSGPEGIDVNALQETIKRAKPQLLVVQSTVHNPTGSVMDPFRRSRVVALAARHRIPVIDDATLSDTILDGDRRPQPLAAWGDGVVTVGSTSKSFWGGLRVGWARAHPDVVEELSGLKGGEDLGTSVLAQLLAARLLSQIERARDQRHQQLSRARSAVMEALSVALPSWETHPPTGGASLWVRLPVPRATAFTQHADRFGVRLLPGPTFSCSDGLDDHLRVAFPGPLDSTLHGIEIMTDAWTAFH